MKQLVLLIFSIFLTIFVIGQAPMVINYQGIARNASGTTLTNQNISLRLSIHDGSSSGSILYQETRSLKTDRFGMFVVAIGGTGATNVLNSITSIDWSIGGGKFLQVELSPNNNSTFIDMGAAQLLSIPYAFLAKSAYPIGVAGGDLSGTYPNPTIATNAINTGKILDSAVTTSKIADHSITASKLSVIPASGDLTGFYPNPVIADGVVFTSKIADSAVTTPKIKDSSITLAKLARGVVSGSLGTAGGDLSGTYPNPVIINNAITTNKILDQAVTTSKIADRSLTLAKFTLIAAGGDLTGLYPSPIIANNVVSTSKIMDSAITTAKIKNGSITLAKLGSDVIIGGSGATGPAGGDLSGTYPNPNVSKLQGNGISNTTPVLGQVLKFDGVQWSPGKDSIGGSGTTGPAGGDLSGTYPNPNVSKLQGNGISNTTPVLGQVLKFDGVQWSPGKDSTGGSGATGPAGGDLSGTYPNPNVSKLQGNGISNTTPVLGQVLKFDGVQWSPAKDSIGTFSLPFNSSVNSASNLVSITNQGSGTALEGINSSVNNNAVGILGKINSITPGTNSSAVRGMNYGTGADGYGIWGSHAGSGSGVYGSSPGGMGINGFSDGGYGVYGNSTTGTGIFATSDQGTPAGFDISNPASFSDAVFSSNAGYGNGITSIATLGNGVLGIGNDAGGTGIFGINNAGGEAILGFTISDYASGVVGRNDGTYAGVRGFNTANNGIGVLAVANSNGATNGTALVAEIEGADIGNTAVFKANNSNVARIDNTGKGFFNGGTQLGGADVAEFFDIEGNRTEYEPGDVLIISQSSDRKVERSSSAYSTLVAGVYATKPGVLLTEKNAEKDSLEKMVPMGVIGVIPTKVCLEGGIIMRGDLLVTSSTEGVAMKADLKKVQIGQVLGKALQSYNEKGVGKINVLVSVK